VDRGRWRVSPPLAWAKIAAFVAFALVAVVYLDDRTRAFAAGVGALLIGAYALRDIVAAVRVAADPSGITVVAGYASKVFYPWDVIEAVRVDTRSRLGLRTEMLEIDAGEQVHLFSTYDLNAPCSEVADTLQQIRDYVGRSAS
jgi:hypothetical protein